MPHGVLTNLNLPMLWAHQFRKRKVMALAPQYYMIIPLLSIHADNSAAIVGGN
jgi:hypothetical protein